MKLDLREKSPPALTEIFTIHTPVMSYIPTKFGSCEANAYAKPIDS